MMPAPLLLGPLVLGTWVPMDRPVVGVIVEASVADGAPLSRARVVELLGEVVGASSHARLRDLSANALSHCGGDLECRLDVARAAGSPVLVILYLTASADYLSLDLEVRSSTLATAAPGSRLYEIAEPWSVVAPAPFPSEEQLRAWLGASLVAVLQLPEYRLSAVRLSGLPIGAQLTIDGALFVATASELDVLLRADAAVDLRVEPPGGAPVLVPIAPGTRALALDGLLGSTSASWLRQGTFWSAVASMTAGAVVLVAAATGSPGLCVRHRDTEAPCPAQVPIGAVVAGVDATLPAVGAGLLAAGVPALGAGLWEQRAEAEVWWLLAGVGLGALAAGSVALALGEGP